MIFKVFRAQDRNFDEKELPLDRFGVGIIEDRPYRNLGGMRQGTGAKRDTNEVFQLSPSLFDDTILALEYDTHATEVGNFSAAYDQRVDVESSAGQNTRNTREDTGLVLNETVQDVPKGRLSIMSVREVNVFP